jgi:outer membrane cobalamin receptor
MVASMFGSLGSNHRNALRLLFENAPGWIGVSDPAGHSGNLDGYLTKDARTAVTSRFAEALERTRHAIAAEGKEDHTEAKRLWRIELGDEFPLT